MPYPEEVIALGSRGRREARILRSMGTDFAVYGYADSGRELEKCSVLLRREEGAIDHVFIIRLPKGKELVVKHGIEKEPKERGIFDGKGKKVVYF